MSVASEEQFAFDVVVVEDNDNDAQMTLLALRRLSPSPKVLVLTDGEAALARLTGNTAIRPRLVLLDLKMPKVGGLEVLEGMKADEGAEGIPVVIFTSSDEPRDVQRAQELGCASYVCKPIEWDAYRRAVADVATPLLTES